MVDGQTLCVQNQVSQWTSSFECLILEPNLPSLNELKAAVI